MIWIDFQSPNLVLEQNRAESIVAMRVDSPVAGCFKRLPLDTHIMEKSQLRVCIFHWLSEVFGVHVSLNDCKCPENMLAKVEAFLMVSKGSILGISKRTR
jgi:hypothetical protein